MMDRSPTLPFLRVKPSALLMLIKQVIVDVSFLSFFRKGSLIAQAGLKHSCVAVDNLKLTYSSAFPTKCKDYRHGPLGQASRLSLKKKKSQTC